MVLPIEIDMQQKTKGYLQKEVEDADLYAQQMCDIKESIYEKAITNIREAQRQQKKGYDKKHCRKVARSCCILIHKLHDILHK